MKYRIIPIVGDSGGIHPSGTLNITSNDVTVDVTQYKYVDVNIQFTIPEVSRTSITDITYNSAVYNCTIEDGNKPITDSYLEWWPENDPADIHTIQFDAVVGSNSISMTDLPSSTRIAVRPHVTNIIGEYALQTSYFQTEDAPNYFYFEDISGSNNILTLYRTNTGGYAPTVVLEYSTDGVNWQEWQAVNDVRTYTIPANGKFYLRGDNTAFGQGSNNSDVHTFSSTGNIEAHGNIMTLLDKTGQSTSFATSGTFKRLFQNMTTLKTAPELPATTLSNSCYDSMFKGSGITQSPELPATNILTSSYYQIFMNCASLTKAGKMIINSFTGTSSCREMYSGCSNLTDISDISINETNFTNFAMRSTFENCASLTKAVSMIIAQVGTFSFDSAYAGCTALNDISGIRITTTTANEGSFKLMFKGTAITESPDLSSIKTLYAATNNGSFSFMFENCSNLNKVTVGCSTWDTNYAYRWLFGVSSTGDFYNLGGATIPTGTNGRPSGWTLHTSL